MDTAEIRTGYFPNSSVERYPYINLHEHFLISLKYTPERLWSSFIPVVNVV